MTAHEPSCTTPRTYGVRPPARAPRGRHPARAARQEAPRFDATAPSRAHRPTERRHGHRDDVGRDEEAPRRSAAPHPDRRRPPLWDDADHRAREPADPPRALERSRQGARRCGHPLGGRARALRAALRLRAHRDRRQGKSQTWHIGPAAFVAQAAGRVDEHPAQSSYLAVFHAISGRDAAHAEHRLAGHPGDRARGGLRREPRSLHDDAARRVPVPDAKRPRRLRRRDVPPHVSGLGHGRVARHHRRRSHQLRLLHRRGLGSFQDDGAAAVPRGRRHRPVRRAAYQRHRVPLPHQDRLRRSHQIPDRRRRGARGLGPADLPRPHLPAVQARYLRLPHADRGSAEHPGRVPDHLRAGCHRHRGRGPQGRAADGKGAKSSALTTFSRLAGRAGNNSTEAASHNECRTR